MLDVPDKGERIPPGGPVDGENAVEIEGKLLFLPRCYID